LTETRVIGQLVKIFSTQFAIFFIRYKQLPFFVSTGVKKFIHAYLKLKYKYTGSKVFSSNDSNLHSFPTKTDHLVNCKQDSRDYEVHKELGFLYNHGGSVQDRQYVHHYDQLKHRGKGNLILLYLTVNVRGKKRCQLNVVFGKTQRFYQKMQ